MPPAWAVSLKPSVSPWVQRAAHCFSVTLEYMGIDHGGTHILMAEQFLRGTNVIAIFQQMGDETVVERMAAATAKEQAGHQGGHARHGREHGMNVYTAQDGWSTLGTLCAFNPIELWTWLPQDVTKEQQESMQRTILR